LLTPLSSNILKEETESGELVIRNDSGELQPLDDDAQKVIQVNGDRLTPEMLRELVSKNPEKVTSALRMWSSRK